MHIFLFVLLGVAIVNNGHSEFLVLLEAKHYVLWFEVVVSEASIVDILNDVEKLDDDFKNLTFVDLVLDQVVLKRHRVSVGDVG